MVHRPWDRSLFVVSESIRVTVHVFLGVDGGVPLLPSCHPLRLSCAVHEGCVHGTAERFFVVPKTVVCRLA